MTSRVAIQKCKTYDLKKVFDTLDRLFTLLGGLEKFVKKGQKVLLKPNMLSAKSPDQGITTHPVVLEAVVRLFQAAGGEIWIGDSPSGAIKGIKHFWKNTGFQEVADRTGATLINFETGGVVPVQSNGQTYYLAKPVFDADLVINLPKLKTHGLTLFTGAIKNCFGTLPGLQKPAMHRRFPNPGPFSQRLVDIYEAVRPGMHIMDGILAMAGNGPATGDLKETGLILVSTDGVALDTVVSHLMGFKEGEVDAIRIAGERGLGVSRLQEIEIVGESLENIWLHDFNLPSNYLMRLIPQFLVRWVSRFIWVRPVADVKKCVGCGICHEGCPLNAIEMINGYPVMDYHRCINCLCCNESCPENAIVQKMSWLAKRLG